MWTRRVEGSSAAVLRNWEEIKAAEKSAASRTRRAVSRLDSVCSGRMPALAEAAKLGAKAQKAGFDWPHWRDLLPKLAEETAELEAEAASDDPARKPAVEAELGDLLFTVVNLGRHLGVDAEMALRGCNLRFRAALPRDGAGVGAAAWKSFPPDELEALVGGEAEAQAGRTPVHRRQAMIVIRSCSGFDELEACVQLEIETWGYDPTDVFPARPFWCHKRSADRS